MNTEPPPAPASFASSELTPGRWTWRTVWPPLAVTGVLLAVMGTFMAIISRLNGGRLTYPVDDVYLHFAIAKNFLHHGIWGYSALNGFSSGDSSLLYPVLLAAWTAVSGNVETGGLVLNVLAFAGVMFYAAGFLRRYGITGGPSFLVLLATLFLAALPTVAATGMEHGVQILIDLAFVSLAAEILAAPPAPGLKGRGAGLLVLGALVTTIRFEGMFLIGLVGLLLLIRRRWTLAVGLGVCAGAPLALFGLYSLSQGWSVLPASVLIKGNTNLVLTPAGLAHFFDRSRQALAENPQMVRVPLAMAGVLMIELYRRRTLWTPLSLMLVITLGGCALQVQFAALGWMYRYEAYLLVIALLTLGAWVARELAGVDGAWWRGATAGARGWVVLVVLGVLILGVGLRKRTYQALTIVPPGAHNIFEQQYQMALFLHEFYEGKGVAANDIGLIDYLAELRLVDLMGLGDIDVVRAKRSGTYDHALLRRLMARREVQIMVMYHNMGQAVRRPVARGHGGRALDHPRQRGLRLADRVVLRAERCADPRHGARAPGLRAAVAVLRGAGGAVLRRTPAARAEFSGPVPGGRRDLLPDDRSRGVRALPGGRRLGVGGRRRDAATGRTARG